MRASHMTDLRLFFLWPLLVATLATTPVRACGPDTPCTVDGGEYYARVPDGWDGHSPLSAVLFLHGYSSSAQAILRDVGLGEALSREGVLLILPQGIADGRGVRSWSLPIAPSRGRDDFAFNGRVVDDAEKRWPIDRKRLIASGFSVGGSMTWYIACRMPGQFAAFAPVAGAFWVPEPEDCAGGPVSLRHVHGLSDETVPMKGRILRGGAMRQGDVMHGMATWRRIDGCPETPSSETKDGLLTCQTWSSRVCSSGRELMLCLHPGDHEVEAQWVVDAVHWAASLPQNAPASRQLGAR